MSGGGVGRGGLGEETGRGQPLGEIELPHRQLGPQQVPDLGGEAHQEQRVAAQVEEVVVVGDALDTEGAFPQRDDLPERPDQQAFLAEILSELNERDRWLLVFDNAERPRDLEPTGPATTAATC